MDIFFLNTYFIDESFLKLKFLPSLSLHNSLIVFKISLKFKFLFELFQTICVKSYKL